MGLQGHDSSNLPGHNLSNLPDLPSLPDSFIAELAAVNEDVLNLAETLGVVDVNLESPVRSLRLDDLQDRLEQDDASYRRRSYHRLETLRREQDHVQDRLVR